MDGQNLNEFVNIRWTEQPSYESAIKVGRCAYLIEWDGEVFYVGCTDDFGTRCLTTIRMAGVRQPFWPPREVDLIILYRRYWMVTDQQVILLRRRIMEGKTQQASAATAGMSARSARRWQRGPLPSEKKNRSWRTRPDAFSEVWEEEIVPLLRRDAREKLQATVLLEWLDERYPGRFNASHLRTLQRRLRDWRALSGPEREVYFEQEHPPGREAQMDFTHCDSLEVTIGGEPFEHMLFEFILSHSGWRYAQVCFSETAIMQIRPSWLVPDPQ